jgi:hypothetical protein
LMGKSILLYVMPTLAPQAPLAKLASTILHWHPALLDEQMHNIEVVGREMSLPH